MPDSIPSSVYAEQMGAIAQEIGQAFRNSFQVSAPFEGDNMVPGDRFGRIRAELIDFNPDRPAMQRNRLGAEAKVVQYALFLAIAFEGEGKTDEENFLAAEALFLKEALSVEHRLAIMTEGMSSYGFLEGLRLNSPIDNRLSQGLHDRNTWRLDIVANFELSFYVKRDLRGLHIPLPSMD